MQTAQEQSRRGWDYIDHATQALNDLYGNDPISEDQAMDFMDQQSQAADQWIEANEMAVEWSEYQNGLAQQEFEAFQQRGQDYWDKQQEAQRSHFEASWNETVQEYEKENAPQSYAEMQDLAKGESLSPGLRPSAGDQEKEKDKRTGMSYEPAANAARQRERAMESRQEAFADRANDQSLPQSERDKASLAGQIEKLEFDAGRMHGIANRMDSASAKNPWADKYEAKAEARDGHLINLKESWNQQFPDEKIPVTDSQGNARSAQECFDSAKQHQARFEAHHKMGKHSDLEQHQAEFKAEMQPPATSEPQREQKAEAAQETQLEQAEAAKTEQQQEGASKNPIVARMEAQHAQDVAASGGQRKEMPSDVAEWREKSLEQIKTLQEGREQSKGKGNERERENEQEVLPKHEQRQEPGLSM